MSAKPKIGLIMIGDPRLGDELDGNHIITDPPRLLRQAGIEVIGGERMLTMEDEARPEAIRIRNEGADGLVLYAVWFLRANAMAGAAQAAGLPVALWTLPDEDGASAVGFGVSHGALGEMGIEHEIVFGPWEGEHLCKGGACTGMLVSPGPGTIARFGRIEGEYVLHLTGCEIVEHAHADDILFGLGGSWPFAYLKPEQPVDLFLQNVRAHHMCLARGGWVQDMGILAGMWGIEVL